ncbi:MAG: hypothetical protein CMJ46_11930 [Planctomyces sp.]|nr:hypothetical protein [Planctomyces sp.]
MEHKDEPAGIGEGLLTSQQIMDYLQIKRTTLWKLVKQQGLPAYQFGAKGDYRFRKSEVDAWISKQSVKGDDAR